MKITMCSASAAISDRQIVIFYMKFYNSYTYVSIATKL
jgi:hypothetical protein